MIHGTDGFPLSAPVTMLETGNRHETSDPLSAHSERSLHLLLSERV